MSTNILFLDIDWVLATEFSTRLEDLWTTFSDTCVKNLDRICNEVPWLQIVISSTWRKGRTIQELREMFKIRGFSNYLKVIDKTPNLARKYETAFRWEEIHSWIKENYPYQYINYVIVDDDSDMLEYQMKRFVKTDTFIWLSDEKTNEIINLFKNYVSK